ncbi:ArdC-like ssDNA-binding domain-containing protein [Acidipropionibacterium timonense]|uniref:ArdC-like ssDNA-binding domain-containing protein n=1 Tax=Acidipropionibacterium timonense TaxID=2161818 RepID=UPI00103013BE|nr:ArdC-like ssDNA-binding domain-containing protein [Acidipropionibacterium timonense]
MNRKSSTAKKAAREAEMHQLHAQFVEQVNAWRQPEAWQAWLDMAAKFHHYSVHNLALIVAQCPTASLVAGYRTWQAQGRQVRRGEKGIRILGGRSVRPADDDDTDEEENTSRPGVVFFPVSVFDIDQTDPIDGVDAMPDAPSLPQLTGADPAGIIDAIDAYLTGQGWTITRAPLPHNTHGLTDHENHTITIAAGIPEAHTAKTMLHEATHALLHTDRTAAALHRGRLEVEAESTAYLAAATLGLDTSDYSTGYVAGWAANAEQDVLITTAETILTTARHLVDIIEASHAGAELAA